MPARTTTAIAGVLAAFVVVELAVILPRPMVVVLALVAVWFALPGIVLVSRALGAGGHARASAWLAGPAVGFGISGFTLFLFWAAGLQNWLALIAAPPLAAGAAWMIPDTQETRLRLPAFDRRDTAAVCCALLAVPLITLAPYDHVREPVADGEAYRAYFTADFVWAMTVSAELAKGDVPPANPFHYAEPMRYYWMSHLLSGAVYRNVQQWGVGSEPVVLVNGLSFGLAFVAFFYWLARTSGASAWWAAAAVLIGFLANSYEGADMIRAIIVHDDSWAVLRDTNIDAVSRWFYHGMAVDGLQRLLLYQPHHLTGYVLALSSLWLVARAERVGQFGIAIGAGSLLALALLFSTFSAVMVGPAVAIVYAVRLMQQRSWRAVAVCAVAGAVPAALGLVLVRALGYTNPADGLLLQVGLNPTALVNVRWVLFVSFGPLLVLGLAGLFRVRWIVDAGLAAAVLVAAAFAFYFFTDVPDMGGVWVGWRSGHMLLIAFAVSSGALLTTIWQRSRLRPFTIAGLAALVVPATATVAVDVYNAQDIRNRTMGANFPWTLVITPPEREALDWIRATTAPDAIVQPEPYVRDQATWAYVPAFAERRMAAGLPISMIPLREYQQTSEVVRTGIFRAHSADDAAAVARSLAIEYLLIGREEAAAYGPTVERLLDRSDLFQIAFRNDLVTVLHVLPASN